MFFTLLVTGASAWAQTGDSTSQPGNPPSDFFATTLRAHGYTVVPMRGGESPNYGYDASASLDTHAVSLLLDSGSLFNLITLHANDAAALGVKGASFQIPYPLDRPKKALQGDTTHVNGLTLGTMHLGPQFLGITRTDVDNPNPTPRILVGAPFLHDIHAVMDYAHETLYVCDASQSTCVTVAGADKAGYVAVPLTRTSNVAPGGSGIASMTYVLHAVIDSTSVLLLLDTMAGGEELILDPQRAKRLGIALHVTQSSDADGPSIGHQQVSMGKLDRITLGTTVQLQGPSFMTTDLSAVNRDYTVIGLPQIDGVLCAKLLKARGAVIDFGHDVLYLRK